MICVVISTIQSRGGHHAHAITKPHIRGFLCCGYSAVAVLVDISVMGITISASCPPASAILRFALSSASYRAGLRQWLFPKESTG